MLTSTARSIHDVSNRRPCPVAARPGRPGRRRHREASASRAIAGGRPRGFRRPRHRRQLPRRLLRVRCRLQPRRQAGRDRKLAGRAGTRVVRESDVGAPRHCAGNTADRERGDGRHRRRRHSRGRLPELVRDAGRQQRGHQLDCASQRRPATAVEGREDRFVPDVASRRVGGPRRRRQEGIDQRAADRRKERRADVRPGQGVGVLVQPEGLEAARRHRGHPRHHPPRAARDLGRAASASSSWSPASRASRCTAPAAAATG